MCFLVVMRRGKHWWRCGDEYVQRMTFESYLYKKLADGNRWDDAKMVLNTVGSLMRCKVLGRKMEALKI